MNFDDIPEKDINYLLKYYNIETSENKYLTAWNLLLINNAKRNFLVPLSISDFIKNYNSISKNMFRTQTYYRQTIMKPYVGLRILKRKSNGLYENYKVMKVYGTKTIKDADIVKVNMKGEQISEVVERISLVKKEKLYTNRRQEYKFVFTDNMNVYIGIATDEGFPIESYDDENMKYKSKFKIIDGISIPEINLIVTASNGYIIGHHI